MAKSRNSDGIACERFDAMDVSTLDAMFNAMSDLSASDSDHRRELEINSRVRMLIVSKISSIISVARGSESTIAEIEALIAKNIGEPKGGGK